MFSSMESEPAPAKWAELKSIPIDTPHWGFQYGPCVGMWIPLWDQNWCIIKILIQMIFQSELFTLFLTSFSGFFRDYQKTFYLWGSPGFLAGPFFSPHPKIIWLGWHLCCTGYLSREMKKNTKLVKNIWRMLWGPSCPWPRLRRPGSRARQRPFKPGGGRGTTVGLGGTIVRTTSTAWLDSFPPLESPPLATWVRCKVQVLQTDTCRQLHSAETYLSVQGMEGGEEEGRWGVDKYLWIH